MENGHISWITSFIWNIADDVLRDLFKRGKYPDVILPMCVLRRMDAVLEPTKKAVLETKQMLDQAGITEQRAALAAAAGQSFYNTSRFTLRDLKSRGSQQQLLADFEDYLNGFSQNVQDILENFKFRNQLPTLSRSDSLGTLIAKFLDPKINLSPAPVLNDDGTVIVEHGRRTEIDLGIEEFGNQGAEGVRAGKRGELVAEFEVFEDILDVLREAVQVILEVRQELLLAAARFEVAQGKPGCVVEGLTGRGGQGGTLFDNAGLIEHRLGFEHGLFGRFEDGIHAAQDTHGQDDIRIFAASEQVAEYVVGDVPDETGDPAYVAIFHGFVLSLAKLWLIRDFLYGKAFVGHPVTGSR